MKLVLSAHSAHSLGDTMPRFRWPTLLTHRTHRQPPWPINAVHLYDGLRCTVIVEVDETASCITVRYPRRGVRFEKMRAILVLKDTKLRPGHLNVTLESKNGNMFELSPAVGEPEGTIQITVPGLVRSDDDYRTRKITVAVHNGSSDRKVGEPGVINVGDLKAYRALHKPTF